MGQQLDCNVKVANHVTVDWKEKKQTNDMYYVRLFGYDTTVHRHVSNGQITWKSYTTVTSLVRLSLVMADKKHTYSIIKLVISG